MVVRKRIAAAMVLPTILLLSCPGPAVKTADPVATPSVPAAASITTEVERMVYAGNPASLLAALDKIKAERIDKTEFGREMSFLSMRTLQAIYPDIIADLSPPEPPRQSVAYKAFKAVDAGELLEPEAGERGFAANVYPLFVLLSSPAGIPLSKASTMLARAKDSGTVSVLVPYFAGVVAELAGDRASAAASYKEALSFWPDCYPAEIGTFRLELAGGRPKEAVAGLKALRTRYPENPAVRKWLAEALYAAGSHDEALPLIAQVLLKEPDNPRFLLMRAHILIEQKSYAQAQQLLDAYALAKPTDRLYLVLRAQLLTEFQSDLEGALAVLKSGIKLYPADLQLLGMAEEVAEKLGLLAEARGYAELSLELSPDDVLLHERYCALLTKVGDFAAAALQVEYLVDKRGDNADYELAASLYWESGDLAACEGAAKVLYDRDPAKEAYVSGYVRILAERGKAALGKDIAQKALAAGGSPGYKSALHYYLSRFAAADDEAMGELRLSLLEDPQNRDALIAMYDIYYRLKDYKKAQYYLKQAIALDPSDPKTAKRQGDLTAALGSP